MPALDVHFHVVPPGFREAATAGRFKEVVEVGFDGDQEIFVFHPPAGVPVEPNTEIDRESWDVSLILAALDERKLTGAIASPAPELFMNWTQPAVGAEIAVALNDAMGELARSSGGRLLGLAALPLQDPALAVHELRRAIKTVGLRGIAVCTNVNGVDLDAAGLDPVFSLACELDVPIFIHPQNAGDMTRFTDYHLWNVVGFPFETGMAAARLILSGTLERHPDLKIILAHGGGYFPYQIGRLDRGYRAKEHLRKNLPHPPSHYLKNIYCDALIHDQTSLRFLVERLGPDRVVLGCDYPFDMGSAEVVDWVRALKLKPTDEAKILGGNLADLFRYNG